MIRTRYVKKCNLDINSQQNALTGCKYVPKHEVMNPYDVLDTIGMGHMNPKPTKPTKPTNPTGLSPTTGNNPQQPQQPRTIILPPKPKPPSSRVSIKPNDDNDDENDVNEVAAGRTNKPKKSRPRLHNLHSGYAASHKADAHTHKYAVFSQATYIMRSDGLEAAQRYINAQLETDRYKINEQFSGEARLLIIDSKDGKAVGALRGSAKASDWVFNAMNFAIKNDAIRNKHPHIQELEKWYQRVTEAGITIKTVTGHSKSGYEGMHLGAEHDIRTIVFNPEILHTNRGLLKKWQTVNSQLTIHRTLHDVVSYGLLTNAMGEIQDAFKGENMKRYIQDEAAKRFNPVLESLKQKGKKKIPSVLHPFIDKLKLEQPKVKKNNIEVCSYDMLEGQSDPLGAHSLNNFMTKFSEYERTSSKHEPSEHAPSKRTLSEHEPSEHAPLLSVKPDEGRQLTNRVRGDFPSPNAGTKQTKPSKWNRFKHEAVSTMGHVGISMLANAGTSEVMDDLHLNEVDDVTHGALSGGFSTAAGEKITQRMGMASMVNGRRISIKNAFVSGAISSVLGDYAQQGVYSLLREQGLDHNSSLLISSGTGGAVSGLAEYHANVAIEFAARKLGRVALTNAVRSAIVRGIARVGLTEVITTIGVQTLGNAARGLTGGWFGALLGAAIGVGMAAYEIATAEDEKKVMAISPSYAESLDGIIGSDPHIIQMIKEFNEHGDMSDEAVAELKTQLQEYLTALSDNIYIPSDYIEHIELTEVPEHIIEKYDNVVLEGDYSQVNSELGDKLQFINQFGTQIGYAIRPNYSSGADGFIFQNGEIRRMLKEFNEAGDFSEESVNNLNTKLQQKVKEFQDSHLLYAPDNYWRNISVTKTPQSSINYDLNVGIKGDYTQFHNLTDGKGYGMDTLALTPSYVENYDRIIAKDEKIKEIMSNLNLSDRSDEDIATARQLIQQRINEMKAEGIIDIDDYYNDFDIVDAPFGNVIKMSDAHYELANETLRQYTIDQYAGDNTILRQYFEDHIVMKDGIPHFTRNNIGDTYDLSHIDGMIDEIVNTIAPQYIRLKNTVIERFAPDADDNVKDYLRQHIRVGHSVGSAKIYDESEGVSVPINQIHQVIENNRDTIYNTNDETNDTTEETEETEETDKTDKTPERDLNVNINLGNMSINP